MIGDGEEDGLLTAGPGGQPNIAEAGGVAQARVEGNEFGAIHLAFNDALGVGVEVVAGFQVARDEQDDAGVGVVGAGAVEGTPHEVAHPRPAGADVGVAVVAVHPPGLDTAIGVAIFSGTADVVHNAVFALLATLAHLGGNIAERFIPTDALPLAFAALAHALERVEDAFGVVNLVVGGRAFGAVAPSAAGMFGVTLELFDFQRGFVYVGQQAAGALAVEADGGDEHVAARHLARPGLAVVLYPVVPVVGRGVLAETAVWLLNCQHMHIGWWDFVKFRQGSSGDVGGLGWVRPLLFRRRTDLEYGS